MSATSPTLSNYSANPSNWLNKIDKDNLKNYGFLVDSQLFDKKTLHDKLSHVLALICSQIRDGIFVLDEHLSFVCVNKEFLKITGLEADKVLGSHSYNLDYQKYSPQLHQDLDAIVQKLHKKQSVSTLLTLINHDLQQVATQLDISATQIDNNCTIFLGLLSPQTDKYLEHRTAQKLCHYDTLTGLLDYDAFYEKLKRYFTYKQSHDSDCLGMLLRVNISKLQSYNLSLGIANTNLLLQSFVNRFKSIEIEGVDLDDFSRFGGDSFAALLSFDNIVHAYQYLDEIKHVFSLPFIIDNQTIYLRICVGISQISVHTNDAQTLLLQADMALKQACLTNNYEFVWYDDNQQQQPFKNIHLLSAFESALSTNQIVSYFQPKLCFAKPDLPMFEALVRWQHPTYGLLYPKDFLDQVLEKYSQTLFEKIMLTCVDQLIAWRNIGYDCLVCVNIDSRQLTSENFIQFIETMLGQYTWLPKSINFEITEISNIHDEIKAQNIFGKLHQMGFNLSIDDFGTGFAAMQYLLKYPIDILKIDQLFIVDILKDRKKQIIVQSIIAMAHALSMQVLAEGASSVQEINYLKELGCDFIQGFGYSKPMSHEATTEWLRCNFKPNC